MSEAGFSDMQKNGQIAAVVFDVGRVIVRWNLRYLFARLIEDADELDWFLTNVVTEEWHFQHDAGRALADMVPERQAEFPQYASLIEAYRDRFLETIPGPIPGTADLMNRLDAAAVPLFAITNFGDEFWAQFRPTRPELDLLRDTVVSGTEKLVKPDPAIFQLAEQRFGFAASDMLFIDDNAANIASADRLGWQTHLFIDAPTLEADLKARDLIP